MIFLILAGIVSVNYHLYSNPDNTINEFYLRYNIEKFSYISHFAFYNQDFGLKKISFIVDSLKIANRIHLGDYQNLRGITIEKIPFLLNPTIIIGKEKDIGGRFFPYFKDNIFFLGIKTNSKFLNSEFVYRIDRSIYSPSEMNAVFRNYFGINRGNLKNKISFALGSYSYDNLKNIGYDLEYTFDYRKERFFQLIRYRNIKEGFVNERNQYFKDGRFELYSITGYSFPFGWGLRYGFYLYGPKNGIIRRFFVNTNYKYRNILINFFGDLEFKMIDFKNIHRGFNLTYTIRSFSTSLNYSYNRTDYFSEIFDISLRYAPFPNAYYYFDLKKGTGNKFYTMSGFNLPFGKRSRINFEFSTLYNNLHFRNIFRYSPSNNLDILTGITYNLNDNRYTFTLELSSSFKTEDIGLTGIYGKVYFDKNNNNIFDKDDEIIKNARIVIDDRIFVDLDKNGNYKYYFLSPGEHKIKIDLKNQPSFIGASKYEYTVKTENMKIVNIDFPLKGLGTIYGKIFYDINGNSIFDEGEKGIPNIIVKIPETAIFTITDSDGNYKIENLLPNFYTLKLNNLPNGFGTNPPDLLIYAYIKEYFERVEINIGLIETKKRIKIKRF